MSAMHLLALQLMAVQGALGAFDTVYHHEGTQSLPQRDSAGPELSIHAMRSALYAFVFIGLSAWTWQGLWAWVLMAIFCVEIGLTLWDFVVEDRTRLLPATERVTHTVLAVNGGAIITMLGWTASDWSALPTAMAWQPQGWLGAWLALCGLGVGVSALRDGLAARKLLRRAAVRDAQGAPDLSGTAHPSIRCGRGPQRVLVTGGTGFIGQVLVRHLLADGHAVTVLSRDARAAAWHFGGQVRCVRSLADISSTEDFGVVINLAGAPILGPRWTAEQKRRLLQSRVGLTQELGRWMQGRGSARAPWLFISASAVGYYGIGARGACRPFNEMAPPQPIFMSQLCQAWEEAARSSAPAGVRVVCCRLGVVLGHQGALPRLLLPIALGGGGPLGEGSQWMKWIHIQDLLRAFAHIWTATETGAAAGQPADAACVYNLTAPGTVTQAAFARGAAAVMRRPCWFRTPAWCLRLALGEQADLLLEGQRVAPLRLLDEGFCFQFPEVVPALSDLLKT